MLGLRPVAETLLRGGPDLPAGRAGWPPQTGGTRGRPGTGSRSSNCTQRNSRRHCSFLPAQARGRLQHMWPERRGAIAQHGGARRGAAHSSWRNSLARRRCSVRRPAWSTKLTVRSSLRSDSHRSSPSTWTGKDTHSAGGGQEEGAGHRQQAQEGKRRASGGGHVRWGAQGRKPRAYPADVVHCQVQVLQLFEALQVFCINQRSGGGEQATVKGRAVAQ
jgi:hypothetical protein